jgi:hypothetical protein
MPGNRSAAQNACSIKQYLHFEAMSLGSLLGQLDKNAPGKNNILKFNSLSIVLLLSFSHAILKSNYRTVPRDLKEEIISGPSYT